MSGRTGGVKKEILREREKRAWDLRQRSYTHERIAAELELERSTITKILKRLSDRSNAYVMDQINEEKIAQLSELRFIADEAMQSWHKSKEARKSVSKRTSQHGRLRGQNEETTTSVQDQDGDPRYLETAMKALADIRKLLGLDSPEKYERLIPPEVVKDELYTDAERIARITAILDQARERRTGPTAGKGQA